MYTVFVSQVTWFLGLFQVILLQLYSMVFCAGCQWAASAKIVKKNHSDKTAPVTQVLNNLILGWHLRGASPPLPSAIFYYMPTAVISTDILISFTIAEKKKRSAQYIVTTRLQATQIWRKIDDIDILYILHSSFFSFFAIGIGASIYQFKVCLDFQVIY